MSRPHIEFIQSQNLEWQIPSSTYCKKNLKFKVLSVDDNTNASTNIICYPANYSDSQNHCIDTDEEIFVLQGQLLINGTEYAEGDYAYLPIGLNREIIASKYGAKVLTFFEGIITKHRETKQTNKLYKNNVIKHISSHKEEWGSSTDPKLISKNVRRLELRSDPLTGDATWLLDINQNGMSDSTNRLETHPVVEECFVLSGELHMPMGVLTKGAYFWRPAGIQHGPVGTRKGALAIFRSKGGPLTTTWSKEKHEVQWNQPYKPILPNTLKKHVTMNKKMGTL